MNRPPPPRLLYGIMLAFFLLGAQGAIYCFHTHICMDGHFGHPETSVYWPREYLLDAAWSASLLMVMGLALWYRLRWSPLTLFIPMFLLYRFLLGSMGGAFSF